LIDAAPTPFYCTILMTLYATGMRRAEVAALKVSDVDSARMVLHAKEGKDGKDQSKTLRPRVLTSAPSGAFPTALGLADY
jgi:integrase